MLSSILRGLLVFVVAVALGLSISYGLATLLQALGLPERRSLTFGLLAGFMAFLISFPYGELLLAKPPDYAAKGAAQRRQEKAAMKWLTIEARLAFVSAIVTAGFLQKESVGVICVAVTVALISGFVIGADAKRRYLQMHDRFDQEEIERLRGEREPRSPN